jgi:heme ABC exporter ATP-binding subunit CcmA
MLRLRNLNARHGAAAVLQGVDLEVGAGETVALLGPNGAGKSTFLSIASTLLEPSSGTVFFGDRPADSAMRRHVGLLAHDLYLYPELTAAENLSFFASLHGIVDGGRIDSALERARLSERRDDAVFGFSRGMRQRLALERALLHAPRLVLLDEPFTGLDDASTAALVERLRGLRAQGAIVILATHDLETIDGLVDRAVMLRDGRLVALAAGSGSLRERFRQAGH